MTMTDTSAPLPSWNDGPTKAAILEFVARVTTEGGPDYVPLAERIAVFDNDGTLWCEHPLPVQADFFLRRLAAMTEADPTLRERQPWKAAAEGDYAWLGGVFYKHYAGDDSDLHVLAGGLLQAYAGATIEEFEATSAEFLRTAQHPQLSRPYLACAYQPMVELLQYLADFGFANYIASGGGRDFMRPVTEDLYGVPPERVIGSTVALEYQDSDEFATIIHKPALDILDDGPAKPVRVWSRVGRRPILAGGNSNGDIALLRFASHPSRPSLSLLLNHDDAQREYDYQTGAEAALARAAADGWTVISIKDDWTTVFSEPAEKGGSA